MIERYTRKEIKNIWEDHNRYSIWLEIELLLAPVWLLNLLRDLLVNKKIFLQINTGKETTKSGIFPEDTKDFLFFLKNEMQLSISGLMCIPPIDEDPLDHFTKLKLLANENKINELSIGMSDDYELALNFNPTYIRLGTILFGKRIWIPS